MDAYFVISLVVGVISVVLACAAILYGYQAEQKSAANYNQTKEVLAEISEKAAVIQGTVNTTQQKLVDTITDIAKPQRETQEEILMRTMLPALMGDPQMGAILRQKMMKEIQDAK